MVEGARYFKRAYVRLKYRTFKRHFKSCYLYVCMYVYNQYFNELRIGYNVLYLCIITHYYNSLTSK